MRCLCVCVIQVNKPLVERRRRERINRSIDELKSLLISRHQVCHYFTIHSCDVMCIVLL